MINHITKYAALAETEREIRKSVVPLVLGSDAASARYGFRVPRTRSRSDQQRVDDRTSDTDLVVEMRAS